MIFLLAKVLIFLTSLYALAEDTITSHVIKNSEYDIKYRDISSLTKQPVGVVIIAYNRPHYFRQLIRSLEQNPESQTLPFYFLLDGGSRAKQAENADIIKQSSIKYKEIIFRPRNYGYSKTVIDAYKFMFDWCNYKKIIFFEEDLVVSPHYIKLTLNLHEWATSNYSNIGAVSCWSYCFLNKEAKAKLLNRVQEPSTGYWWSFVSYCLDNDVWNEVGPLLYQYEEFIDQIPHTDEFAEARSITKMWEGAPKIQAWTRALCLNKLQIDNKNPILRFRTRPGKKVFPGLNMYRAIRDHYSPTGIASANEDAIMAFCFWLKGYIKIETVVNRITHIGEVGLHYDILNGFKTTIDIFDEDAKLTTFKIKNKR